MDPGLPIVASGSSNRTREDALAKARNPLNETEAGAEPGAQAPDHLTYGSPEFYRKALTTDDAGADEEDIHGGIRLPGGGDGQRRTGDVPLAADLGARGRR